MATKNYPIVNSFRVAGITGFKRALWVSYLILLAACGGGGGGDSGPSIKPTAESQRSLSINKEGAGTVSADKGSLNCGSDCSENYALGTQVTLTAVPASGMVFTGWSGANVNCGTELVCVITMNQAHTVQAQFAEIPEPNRQLQISITGAGAVTSTPGSINCSSGTCSASFINETVVTLQARSEVGYSFSGWSGGACSGTVTTCTVTMNADLNIAATFTLDPIPTYTLSVTKNGNGMGSIISNPARINCTDTSASCSANFERGSAITLKALPNTGYTFIGWSGDACSGASDTCTFTLNAVKAVTAQFAASVGTYALTVSKTGTGSGSVVSNPARISCGASCSGTFNQDTTVNLTATPSLGHTFVGWSGACSGSTSTCSVTMSEAKNVTAQFSVPIHTLSVSKNGAGSGSVVSTPARINCTGTTPTCSAGFGQGSRVTLRATADTGSSFSGWNGACSGVDSTCIVIMSEAKNVTASFVTGYILTVAKASTSTGSGSISSSPAGITNCSTTCTANFTQNTEVTLTASPANGHTLGSWTGCNLITTDNKCKVTINEAKNVTVQFVVPVHTLRVNKTGIGRGSVVSDPARISCTATATSCSGNFGQGSTVTLRATPESGHTFSGWSGACNDIASTCTVAIDTAKTVTATFSTSTALRPLTILKNGQGQGVVISTTPPGMTCPASSASCTHNFPLNTNVTLRAQVSGGHTFAGWQGTSCSGTSTCTVNMSTGRTVTATFNLPTYTLNVNKTIGQGVVVSSPSRIKCIKDSLPGSASCSQRFTEGTKVNLSVTPALGYRFVNWSGACINNNTIPCEIVMNSNQNVTANFTAAHELSVNKVGLGNVTASFNPGSASNNIDCGAKCNSLVNTGTSVQLTAQAATGYTFAGWGGACSGTGNCIFGIANPTNSTNPNNVVANFVKSGNIPQNLQGYVWYDGAMRGGVPVQITCRIPGSESITTYNTTTDSAGYYTQRVGLNVCRKPYLVRATVSPDRIIASAGFSDLQTTTTETINVSLMTHEIIKNILSAGLTFNNTTKPTDLSEAKLASAKDAIVILMQPTLKAAGLPRIPNRQIGENTTIIYPFDPIKDPLQLNTISQANIFKEFEQQILLYNTTSTSLLQALNASASNITVVPQPFVFFNPSNMTGLSGNDVNAIKSVAAKNINVPRSEEPGPLNNAGTLSNSPGSNRVTNVELDWQRAVNFALAWRLMSDTEQITFTSGGVTISATKNQVKNKIREYINGWDNLYIPTCVALDEFALPILINAVDIGRDALEVNVLNNFKSMLRNLANECIDGSYSLSSAFTGIVKRESSSLYNPDNWQANRVYLVTAAAFFLNDALLIEKARALFEKQILRGIANDNGEPYDFAVRDSVHYAAFNLQPLLNAAWIAKLHGLEWHLFTSPAPASVGLQKSLDWLSCYASGERKYIDYLNTTNGFDVFRINEGTLGYNYWDPSEAAYLYSVAARLYPGRYTGINQKLGNSFELWLRLINPPAKVDNPPLLPSGVTCS